MVKERWSNDPNGEVWARDETKVGQKMMEGMGWTAGKGLGAAEQGSTTHVKVNKRALQLGLGADSSTPDKWAEHISDFDGILSRLNASAPSSAPSSAPNSAQVSETEQEQPATKRRKKSKNLYTKFKKNKNLSSLSEKDMAHIFGESTKEVPTITPTQDTPPQPEPDMTGVKTVTSSMSLADYFNSKKKKLAPKQAPVLAGAAHPSRASSLTNDWHRQSTLDEEIEENRTCEEGEERSSFKFEFSVESEESKKKKEIRKEVELDFAEKKKKQKIKKKKSKQPHLKECQRELPEKWE